jgi:Uma2 family endonuclease
MSTATLQENPAKRTAKAAGKEKRISWEKFQEEYLTREDEYKYEWLDGVVEKTKRTMDTTQFYILRNLLSFFQKLKDAGKVKGWLISEGDAFFSNHHRRPDIAYFTDEQIDKGRAGEKPVPQFVIEVISTYDMIRKVHEKMEDYRNAGVPVVWHIFPDLKEVHVYHGREMKIFKGEEVCSAAPTLPDFKMEVGAIFK